jgi:hypothetical protein
MLSNKLGIILPTYLGGNFDLAWELVISKLGITTQVCKLFGMAWHGLGYRACTLEEYFNHYMSLPRYGSAGHDGNYREDQALVDYLFNACSGVDCAIFASYAIGAGLNPNNFESQKKNDLRVERKSLIKKFEALWPSELLTDVLKDVRDQSSFQLLYEIRDVVTHRGTLPRTLYMGGSLNGKVTIPSNSKDLPDIWSSDLVLGKESVADWQGILQTFLQRVVNGVLRFKPLLSHNSYLADT